MHFRRCTGAGWPLLFFFVSGATALIYESIWVRAFALVFGNTTHATATVLAAFMAGLGLGSWWLGRRADRTTSPLALYGWLEIGIGLYAALSLALIDGLSATYVGFAHRLEPGPAGFTFLRFVLSFPIVLFPAMLMGGTLPVLARHAVDAAGRVGREISRLYCANTAGAVAGVLAAGLLLIPALGHDQTLVLAVTANLAVGAAAIRLGRQTARPAPATPVTVAAEASAVPAAAVAAAVFVSGAAAMVLQLAWTRVLAMVVNSSTYAFSIILAVYLLGLALGGAGAARVFARRSPRPADWVFLLALAAAATLAALPAFGKVSLWMIRLYGLAGGNLALYYGSVFVVVGALILVPTICLGAAFPAAADLFARRADAVGHDVGRLYLVNTAGNIAGSLAGGFLLLPRWGLFASLEAAAAAAALAAAGLGVAARPAGLRAAFGRTSPFLLAATAALLVLVHPWPAASVAAGLHLRPQGALALTRAELQARVNDLETLFHRDGLNGTVSVFASGDHVMLKVNGKTDASSGYDMRTQVLAAHLPLLLHPDPRRLLVVGLGSGVTVGSALTHPGLEVDVAEIERGVFDAQPFFGDVNRRWWTDPRARLIVNDARNHLLLERGTYDVIVSEPSNPWMAGVAPLFTVEYYRLARARLAPGGVFAQWLQAYAIRAEDIRRVAASLREVFPHVSLWSTMSHDLLLVASDRPRILDLEAAGHRAAAAPPILADLRRVDVPGVAGLLACHELDGDEFQAFAAGVLPHTDRRLTLEFTAARAQFDAAAGRANREIFEAYRRREWPPSSPPLADRKDLLAEVGEAWLDRDTPGHLDRARACFARANELDADYLPALRGLGRCLLEDGKPMYALIMFTTCLQRDPSDPDTLVGAALAAWRGGDAPLAVEHLQTAAVRDQKRAGTQEWLGRVQESRGEFAAAAAAFDAADRREPRLSRKVRVAAALRQAGRDAEAADRLDAVLAVRPRHAAALAEYSRLGLSARDTGVVARATTQLEAATALNPWREDVWIVLARLYMNAGRGGDFDRAAAAGQRASPWFAERLATVRAIRPAKVATPESPEDAHAENARN